MKNDALLKLLEDLPDDLIDSAADPQPHRRPVLLRYALPAAAACLVIAVSAFLWPKLRTEKPEIAEDSAPVTETTVLPAETEVTDGTAAQGSTLTETTDPYYVHIVTEPVYHFTTAPRPNKTEPDTTEEAGGEEPDTPQDNPGTPNQLQQQGNNRTTTAPDNRGSSQTPSRTSTNSERPVQQGQQTQTEPSAPTTVPSPTNPTPGGEVVVPGNNGRIPCSISRENIEAGNTAAPITDDPAGVGQPKNAEPELAELEGNTLVIRMDRRCSDAMVSYIGLRNGKLTIEVLYDYAQYSRDMFEFRVELPPDIAAGIYDFNVDCYEVDDVDGYIHDRDNVTLVIL